MNDITYTRKPRIAIVDSGIDKSHPIFDNSIVDCIDMTGLDQPEDRQGHGTSVAGIISKNVKQAIIIIIKIICDQHKANIDSLVKALEYI